MFKVPEKNRITKGHFASDSTFGCNGAFELCPSPGKQYYCIVSDGMEWEHVSVEIRVTQGKKYITRVPSWDEMCYIKSVFWDEEDAVMQFHPPKSEYVNDHNFVLHLWRKNNTNPELPPNILV